MDPAKKLKLTWFVLVASALICVPVVSYHGYRAYRAIRITEMADRMIDGITAETEKMTGLKVEIAKELNRLTAALSRSENYDKPDFLDFIDGRGEDLAEISQLLKNALENLEEATLVNLEGLETDDYRRLEVAEVALNIARKKIEEARQLLDSYRRAI